MRSSSGYFIGAEPFGDPVPQLRDAGRFQQRGARRLGEGVATADPETQPVRRVIDVQGGAVILIVFSESHLDCGTWLGRQQRVQLIPQVDDTAGLDEDRVASL